MNTLATIAEAVGYISFILAAVIYFIIVIRELFR